MKLTANEIRHRCIDGEKWRREAWPKGMCLTVVNKELYFEEIKFPYQWPWWQVANAEIYDDWARYKKPFPFKKGENAVCLIRCEHGDVWDLMPCDFLFDEKGFSKCWTFVAEYNYKYFGSDEDIPGMIKAEDLHMYDLEVE